MKQSYTFDKIMTMTTMRTRTKCTRHTAGNLPAAYLWMRTGDGAVARHVTAGSQVTGADGDDSIRDRTRERMY
jgi:hypothetical protein